MEDLEKLPHNKSEVEGGPHRDLSKIDPDLENNTPPEGGDEVEKTA